MNRKTFRDYRYGKLARKALLGVFLGLFLFLQTAPAKDISQYKSNVAELQKNFASLATGEVTREFTENILARASKLLPPEENIEFEGITVPVDNRWIKTEIERYRRETDPARQKLILTGVSERLEAILGKINELEQASATNTGKDEEKQKLAEILNREEFQKPAEEQKSLFSRFLDWLDDLFEGREPQPVPQRKTSPGNFGGVITVMQFLVYGLVIALIGYLIYRFAPFLFKKIRDREKNVKRERVILGERIAEDETSLSLFSEAESLAAEGNLRAAIRQGYIAFLFELSERKLINLAKHKTNRDYLRAVQRKRELYRNMEGLTNKYERHWYGFADPDETDWQEFRKTHDEALGGK